ncbi:MAG: hypothetical protein QXE01_05555 [Sulfolobales archaeon]
MPSLRFAISSNRDPEALLEALRDPIDLFEGVPGVSNVRFYRELGIYQFSITYRRFLTTYLDTIHIVVSRKGDRVVYTSLEPNKLRAEFKVYQELGTTIVEVEIAYEPPGGGQVAMAAIEGVFRKVVEKAEAKAIRIEEARPRQPVKTSLEEAPRIAEAQEIKTPTAIQTESQPSKPIEIGGISCVTCLLYEPELKICTYFAKKVEDPGKPMCGGEKYIKTG